ncbi:hypothetical protein [Gulosibacter faecalis]|uniref:Uncharacterized protein n=1 Tax=Gulosibacter faecalis TaxID=272240 RepID=A0ABW5UUR3_9MICO
MTGGIDNTIEEQTRHRALLEQPCTVIALGKCIRESAIKPSAGGRPEDEIAQVVGQGREHGPLDVVANEVRRCRLPV